MYVAIIFYSGNHISRRNLAVEYIVMYMCDSVFSPEGVAFYPEAKELDFL